jgi:hypothetical protein
MAVTLVPRERTWSLKRDKEGQRTYTITHLVHASAGEGPAAAIQCPGLPLPGSYWSVGGDVDLWAFCTPEADVQPHEEKPGELPRFYSVTQTFSTRPPAGGKRCQDVQIEDPLLEPADVSGSDSEYTEEATHDKDGRPILSSSWEQLRGQQNEWQMARGGIRIRQNVAGATQGYQLPNLLKNHVNDRPMWGFGPRCVRLSRAPWQRRFYGQCEVYYERTLEFDIRAEGWDRELLDEGTKAINGHFDPSSGLYVLDNVGGEAPNPFDPKHFVRFKDRNGENARVILDGLGKPADVMIHIGGYFLSLQDGNTGKSLNNASWWIAIGDPADVIDYDEEYHELVGFARGEIVRGEGPDGPAYYVALADDPEEVPAGVGNVEWAGPFDVLADLGPYDDAFPYDAGNYVSGARAPLAAAKIPVKKYPEANLLALGVPLVF